MSAEEDESLCDLCHGGADAQARPAWFNGRGYHACTKCQRSLSPTAYTAPPPKVPTPVQKPVCSLCGTPWTPDHAKGCYKRWPR